MPVAIETVIIVIVVVSFAVLGAVVFALYWLWRLLLEDRRCNRLRVECGDYTQHPPIIVPSIIEPTCIPPDEPGTGEEPDRALLNHHRAPGRFPRITRRSDVIVDERGRRMGKRERGINAVPPQRTPIVAEVVVLDDTEPPPPYEAIHR